MESPAPFDVVDNAIDAQLDLGCDDKTSSSRTDNPPSPDRIMPANNSLSDSSSAPNSPLAFAFSPMSDNNDNFYASSYDTDLTSFIGSWEQHLNLGSSPSTSRGDKGKHKETVQSLEISRAIDKGKSIDRSRSSSSFEFDFECGQDNSDSNNHSTAVNAATFLPSGVNDPHFHIINDPISVSPSYSSIPSSPDYGSYDAEISHKSSISSLSLKSLRSSSSRSLDRIRRSFTRKDSSLFKPNKGNSLSSKTHSTTAPSPSSHLFSSRSSSSSSLKRGIRKVFGRKVPKKHDPFVLPLYYDTQDENENENEDCTPLDQSIISEATISPRVQSSKAGVQLQDSSVASVPPDTLMPERKFVDLNSEEVFHKTVQGVETWLSTISDPTPRDLFSELLPRELQLRILKMFVYIHEDKYQELNTSKSDLLWTANIAESTRWVGREKGMRALMRLGSISKLWYSLVVDGQLWECMRFPAHITPYRIDEAENLNPSSVPLHPSLLVKLAKRAGLFVRILDLRGWPHLDSASFRAISNALLRSGELSSIREDQSSFPSSPMSTLPSPSLISFTESNLTHLRLRTCTGLTMHNINYIILHSPRLQVLDLHGLRADVVNDSTCELVNAFCPVLEKVDIGRCLGIRGTGLEKLVGGERDSAGLHVNPRSRLKILFASGICGIDPDVMFSLATYAPLLEVLDLSYSDVTDEAVGAFIWCEKEMEAGDEVRRTIEVTSRHLASTSTSLRFTFTMTPSGTYFKRLTSLLHLNLSHTRITGNACVFLSHSVPKLECIELAGIGTPLEAEALVKFFQTTPFIRKIDLEDASQVDDTVLRTFTPAAHTSSVELHISGPGSPSSQTQPGDRLEHLILSYAQNITHTALLSLIRSCTRLITLEVDNTRVWGSVVKPFVEIMRTRGTRDAKIAIMDCRGVMEGHVNGLLDDGSARPRIGFRAFEARAIGGFIDGRDDERRRSSSPEMSSSSSAWLRDITRVEIDECDETRVALKSFWSWQALDAAREHEQKRDGVGRQGRNRFSGHGYGPSGSGPGSLSRPRWLSTWTRYLL